MAVVPFDPKSLLPDESQRHCAVNQPTSASELFDNVQAGKSYTVQIGGVAGAAGNIQFLFDYLVQLKRRAGRSDAHGGAARPTGCAS